MLKLRRSTERGHADHGWLDSYHTFSFASYYDADHMGFDVLRVINEDRIAGGGGFAPHDHHDMEIISYVTEGALEHKDSMGNSTIILPGDVQRMSAGTGVTHSEYNHFADQTTHLLQIWILPDRKGYPPSYDQKSFTNAFANNQLVLVASRDGKNNSVTLHQDVIIYAGKFNSPGNTHVKLNAKQRAWLQVISGNVNVNDLLATSGDGVAITETASINLQWTAPSEFLFFDLG